MSLDEAGRLRGGSRTTVRAPVFTYANRRSPDAERLIRDNTVTKWVSGVTEDDEGERGPTVGDDRGQTARSREPVPIEEAAFLPGHLVERFENAGIETTLELATSSVDEVVARVELGRDEIRYRVQQASEFHGIESESETDSPSTDQTATSQGVLVFLISAFVGVMVGGGSQNWILGGVSFLVLFLGMSALIRRDRANRRDNGRRQEDAGRQHDHTSSGDGTHRSPLPSPTRNGAGVHLTLGHAVAAFAMNLGVPGVGSAFGGYLLEGLGQLVLFGGGFVLTVTIIGAIFGVPIMALAWLWAVWTGGKILDGALDEDRVI